MATPRRPARAWPRGRPRRRRAPSRTPTRWRRLRPSTRSGRPPWASTTSAISSSWRTSASAIASGCASHSAVEPSMSEKQNVNTPVGSAAVQPARRRSTSSPGVFGRRAGSVAIPSRIAASSCSACAGGMPSQLGKHTRRRGARQQRERGRRQRVDVAGARGRAFRGEFRRAVARRPGPPPRHVRRRGQAEVDELDPSAAGQDQVARLDVAVDHRGRLRVQVRERLRRLREVRQHARRGEPRAAAVAEQRRQVGAIDPVHRDDVVVAVEEVLAHERQRGDAAGSPAARAPPRAGPRAPPRRARAGSSAPPSGRAGGPAP